MANEIHVNYASGNTLYTVVRNAVGDVWYVSWAGLRDLGNGR